MGDSSQKAKKGKRTTRRTDTKGTTVKERRKADAQKVKAHAQRVIGDALNADDSSIRSYQDIPRMLRDETLKYALPSDHFDILDATDLCDLFIQIKSKSQNQLASLGPRPQQPTLNTKIQHGQTTPVPSPATTECDVQSEGRAEQDRDEEATEEDLVVAPLEGEEGEKFNVNIYSASRAGPEIVKAYYCQNDRSYISINIIGRHRLRPDLDDTIRLTWEESDISRQGPKMKSTRFWIVEDDKVRNDLAIGKEHDQLDEPDAECGRLDLKHPELTDETSESGDDEDDDSSPDRSDDEDDEEDAEDAEEDDQEGLSETSEVDDEESDSEDAADEEQMSSDDSYVRISPRNQLIVPPTQDPVRRLDRGYQVAGGVLCALIDAVNNSHQDQPCMIPGTTKVARSKLGKAPSKQSSNAPKVKGTKQRAHATRSKQPAPEPECRTRKERGTAKVTHIPSKRRDGGMVSHVSNENLPSSLPLRRKPKKKG